MKRPGVFLLPLDGMLVHGRSLPRNLIGFQTIRWHPFIPLGGERYCESFKVSCPRTQHRDEHTNHEATAPPHFRLCSPCKFNETQRTSKRTWNWIMQVIRTNASVLTLEYTLTFQYFLTMLLSAMLKSFAINFRSFIKRRIMYIEIFYRLCLVLIEKNFSLALKRPSARNDLSTLTSCRQTNHYFFFYQVNILRPVYTGDICRAESANACVDQLRFQSDCKCVLLLRYRKE